MAFGSTPAISAALGKPAPRAEQWKVGSRRWIRFPVHTAFFPMFFANPHMDLSGLVLAITANAYNIVGSILYDKRIEKLAGDAYRRYQAVTGLILPLHPRGASAMDLPAPTHWRHPLRYLPAVVLGLTGGCVYFAALGVISNALGDSLRALGAALLLAIVAGGILGTIHARRFAPDGPGYLQVQAVLATNAAVVSALSLITWVALDFVLRHAIPFPAIVLPMWVTTLWIGHVVISSVAERVSRVGLTRSHLATAAD
jgi:hypothetical protein